jgi:mRNA interferase MazF
VTSSSPPRQRDVWYAELEPIRGREQGGRRPVVAISVDELSTGASELAIVVPTTTVDRGTPVHVRIDPPEGGLRDVSFALPEMVRAVSHDRLVERWGSVRDETLRAIVGRVHTLTRASS